MKATQKVKFSFGGNGRRLYMCAVAERAPGSISAARDSVCNRPRCTVAESSWRLHACGCLVRKVKSQCRKCLAQRRHCPKPAAWVDVSSAML